MSERVPLALRGRNPDALTCIANLSNDEVFTPPSVAQQMLDMVAVAWADSHAGASIWADPKVRFLDPFTKSGVFLREITARLVTGLAPAIPDLQVRVDHILTKQVFGIAVTELTALLARRTLYCSKWADGPHSIATAFANPRGNIWFERTGHTWSGDRCSFCGASKSAFDRGEELESHAYAFIHTNDIQARTAELFGEKMQFDVIVGNPPYQLSTGSTGGAGVQAKPLYNQFVEQAKALKPRYVCMITPSRWFSGGMGLDAFRASMLADNRLRKIEDFPDSNDVFPGTQIKGGVSVFLWEKDNPGLVTVRTHDKGVVISEATRPLLEPGAEVFIRYNQGVEILRKVMAKEGANGISLPKDKQFMSLVSSIGAFGLDTTFVGRKSRRDGDVLVYRNGGQGYIARSELKRSAEVVDWWKVFISPAGSGSDSFPHSILGRPFKGAPGTASSWTYMHIGPFQDEQTTANACSYISCRLFRFLVLLHKPTQHATRAVYSFVPLQDFARPWTDADLYAKYGLTVEETNFIESLIRPMDLNHE
jgi:hypothetical protein